MDFKFLSFEVFAAAALAVEDHKGILMRCCELPKKFGDREAATSAGQLPGTNRSSSVNQFWTTRKFDLEFESLWFSISKRRPSG